MTLNGVGKYTAGAISSIAFKNQTAAVDGNAVRVISRLFAIGACLDKPAISNIIWDKAQHQTPLRAGEFNQAVMDLANAICKPK